MRAVWRLALAAAVGVSLVAIAGSAGPGDEAGQSAPAATAKPAGGEPKWHPGHYAFVQYSTLNETYIYRHFQGVQKMYNWSLLEPEKDRYDFSAIRSDLAFLKSHGKRLVIQIQTKAFGAGQNCCPAYLSGRGLRRRRLQDQVGVVQSRGSGTSGSTGGSMPSTRNSAGSWI